MILNEVKQLLSWSRQVFVLFALMYFIVVLEPEDMDIRSPIVGHTQHLQRLTIMRTVPAYRTPNRLVLHSCTGFCFRHSTVWAYATCTMIRCSVCIILFSNTPRDLSLLVNDIHCLAVLPRMDHSLLLMHRNISRFELQRVKRSRHRCVFRILEAGRSIRMTFEMVLSIFSSSKTRLDQRF